MIRLGSAHDGADRDFASADARARSSARQHDSWRVQRVAPCERRSPRRILVDRWCLSSPHAHRRMTMTSMPTRRSPGLGLMGDGVSLALIYLVALVTTLALRSAHVDAWKLLVPAVAFAALGGLSLKRFPARTTAAARDSSPRRSRRASPSASPDLARPLHRCRRQRPRRNAQAVPSRHDLGAAQRRPQRARAESIGCAASGSPPDDTLESSPVKNPRALLQAAGDRRPRARCARSP